MKGLSVPLARTHRSQSEGTNPKAYTHSSSPACPHSPPPAPSTRRRAAPRPLHAPPRRAPPPPRAAAPRPAPSTRRRAAPRPALSPHGMAFLWLLRHHSPALLQIVIPL
ncbi:unnamed protein product [Nyctereutes procyonoides]|uniref:(raccoon dog) hypothetical protein n=1 Tax=Nyctereutes procyonoides TaxID=34880 RepID=A0A811XYJ2_NYCPR|nr:unnamed protein product [Nyctereutes procyonoides]